MRPARESSLKRSVAATSCLFDSVTGPENSDAPCHRSRTLIARVSDRSRSRGPVSVTDSMKV